MAVDRERLADRLAAVERRLTDAEPDGDGLGDIAAVEGRLSELETRADDLDERLGEVESGLQALRGYVGGVEAVDESVERRADAALAKAEELEALLVEETGLTVERMPTADDRNGERAESAFDDRRSEGTGPGPGERIGDGRNGSADSRTGGANSSQSEGPGDDWPPRDVIGGRETAVSNDDADESRGGLVDRLRDAL
jgi:hypothetical protein